MTRLAKPPNGNGSIRIVIADSHAMFRAALRKLLGAEPDFVVIGEAEDGLEAVARVRDGQPHVVLLDLALPRFSGLEVLREIRSLSPAARALLFVDAIDEGAFIEALCLGARGVAFKTTATDLLLKSIRAVKAGEYWVEHNRIPLLIRMLNDRLGNNGQDERHYLFGLTPRELDIVRAIAAGESTQEMAQMLSRSEVTVRHQLTGIFRKLGVRNRGELLSFAMSQNLAGTGNGSRGTTAPIRSSAAAWELGHLACLSPGSAEGPGKAGNPSSARAILPSQRPVAESVRASQQFEELPRKVTKSNEEKTTC
jgi:DNA-binding NarL/FixJ family response regulator